MNIIIRGADLYSPPTSEMPSGGVLYRTGRRIRGRLKAGVSLTDFEKRNILIGEVGEAAVMADFKRRGYDVRFLSWEEFKTKFVNETATDLIVKKGQLQQQVQVKASENGNRAIRDYNLLNYERSKIDLITFVAVMELDDPEDETGKGRCFECQITSQVMPRHFREMKCWNRTSVGYQHSDNIDFIKDWQLTSARKGSKQIVTPSDVWELAI